MRQLLGELRQNALWPGDEPPGLVLSGGGGKGTYEFGCLEALRDANLKDFSRIAGISVGSLNAALVAQGDLAAARQIWSEISLPKLLQLRFVSVYRRVPARPAAESLLRTPPRPQRAQSHSPPGLGGSQRRSPCETAREFGPAASDRGPQARTEDGLRQPSPVSCHQRCSRAPRVDRKSGHDRCPKSPRPHQCCPNRMESAGACPRVHPPDDPPLDLVRPVGSAYGANSTPCV
jgi:hypothetical protein